MGFKYGHLYHSDHAIENGIDNFPGVDVGENSSLTTDYINNNLKKLYDNVISHIISDFGEGNVYLSSVYRCAALNHGPKGIGAGSKSQHLYGLAADIAVTTHSSRDLFNWAIESLPNGWAQLIWEFPEKGDYFKGKQNFSWVHFSWADGWDKRDLSVATNREHIHERYLQEGYSNRVGKYTHGIPKAYEDIEY